MTWERVATQITSGKRVWLHCFQGNLKKAWWKIPSTCVLREWDQKGEKKRNERERELQRKWILTWKIWNCTKYPKIITDIFCLSTILMYVNTLQSPFKDRYLFTLKYGRCEMANSFLIKETMWDIKRSRKKYCHEIAQSEDLHESGLWMVM